MVDGQAGSWACCRAGDTPYDPLTLGGVTIVLGAVGVAACWYPAARAARVDPAVALRAE